MKGHWFRLTTEQAAALREAATQRIANYPRRDETINADLSPAHGRNLATAREALAKPVATGDRVVVVLTVRQAEDLSHAAGNSTSDPDSLGALFAEKGRRLNCLAAHAKLDDAIRAAGGFQPEPEAKPRRHLLSCLKVAGRWFCAGDCPNHVIVDVDAEAKR